MPGARVGVYEITAQIGEGGMGEVYRARDTKLDRDVAIKILPEAFANDSDRLARFQREAKTLASLNHPNIAIIHGLEEAGDVHALVMELVEGDDLSQRIAHGAIPLDETLPIAKQIAEALEAAHEHGIIHRDLKPANIKVRADGTVKVLDFGLAKAMEPTGAMSASASMSPTITTPAMTHAGIILGTAAYMSPEQARGRPVDKRSDVWSFGAVVFEMLTGRRAFAGADITETMVSVISKEPEWALLPSSTPVSVRSLLRRCLDKDPKRRLRDIGEARVTLDGGLEANVPQTTATATPSAPQGRKVWIAAFAAATLLAAVLVAPALRHLRETPPAAPPETRLEIMTPATDSPSSFALSPDGRQIIFAAYGDGGSRLWLRRLSTTTAQPLAGTEGATAPFWSPDGRSVGFFAASALRRLDLSGGVPQSLAPVLNNAGGTWNADGVIVFARTVSPLGRVPAAGGSAVSATTLGPQQLSHRAPQFLPDGRRFLFYVQGIPDTAGIYLGSLDESTVSRLTQSDSSGVYFPAGWLLWVRAGTLLAQRLDVAQRRLTGEPLTLAYGVAVDSFGRSAVSVAATGLVAYRTGAANSHRQLRWVDRFGTARGNVGDPDITNFNDPRVSRDGRVALGRTVQGNSDLSVIEGSRIKRLTFDSAQDRSPVWSPDGTRIVFHSMRTGRGDLYLKLPSGVEERVVTSDHRKTPTSWSADGRFVLYHSAVDQANTIDLDLWVVPMTGDRTPSVLLKTPFREGYGAFSPDDRWIAYQSDESGRPEIFVRRFVVPGATGARVATVDADEILVSTAGGIHPVWRPDGKELYYLDPSGAMMAVPITVIGNKLEPGSPVRLFLTRVLGGGVDDAQRRQYDVAPDGRFLINTVLDEAAPITLLQNWNPDAKR
jgi:Tol biopolymer transport system component